MSDTLGKKLKGDYDHFRNEHGIGKVKQSSKKEKMAKKMSKERIMERWKEDRIK